ncbi:MAG: complex I NDUFA9 subunit family protein [Pseudomonadota bacterium]|nr:complex I NDUFA9 subunit family protein [Pseudomonadota bacterium]
MQGSRVTVFGGSGFIGRHIVRRLARAGAIVTVAVRDPEAALYLKPMGDVGQITPLYASVRKPKTVARAVEGADIVINLVGVLHQGDQSFAAAHVLGARNVAEAAAAEGVTKLVQLSSIGADAHSPSLYARTKAAGEAEVLKAVPTATIIRPSVVFGPEDGFLNRFGALARISPVMPLFGGGATRFQPVYVGDVADAVMAALTRDDAAGKTYELGGPQVMSLRRIMEFVLAETGRAALLLPVPFPVARFLGTVLGLLPVPPLTADQVKLLSVDNVVAEGMPGFLELGITDLEPLEATAAQWLARFRKPGHQAGGGTELLQG